MISGSLTGVPHQISFIDTTASPTGDLSTKKVKGGVRGMAKAHHWMH